MYKLFLGFFYLFVVCTLGSSIMEGGGGIVVTDLTVKLDAGDLSANVTNTEGFLEADWIWIDGEKISYNATTPTSFDGLTRGYGDTEPVTHSVDTFVYSEDSGIINQALGFNVLVTESTTGDFNAMTFLRNFFTVSIPRIIMWDYAWLKIPAMQPFRILGYCMSAALVVTFCIVLAQLAFGILRR